MLPPHTFLPMVTAHRLVWCAICLLLALYAGVAAAVDPLVLGQSLPMGAADAGTSRRVVEGSRSYIAAINARGGVNGRLLKLVTLDDGNDPARVATNARILVNTHRAVALLNCIGDRSCLTMAQVAAELNVPLIGPMAPSGQLNRGALSHVFRVRASFDKEAMALAGQLQSLAVQSVLVLTDGGARAETAQILHTSLAQSGMRVRLLPVNATDIRTFEAVSQLLSTEKIQAVVLDLGGDTVDSMQRSGYTRRGTWPLLMVVPSSGALNAVISAFPGHMLGFSTVVPSPEASTLPLVRELQDDAERFAEGAAITYEGLEAYLNTRLAVEALRRVGTNFGPGSVLTALESMDGVNLGGISLSFRKDRSSASDFVDIGVRSRTGMLLK